jgi:hypothetical protein
MKKSNEIKLMIIENFIDHFTTDEAERERMKGVAFEYVKEDHVDEIEQAGFILPTPKAPVKGIEVETNYGTLIFKHCMGEGEFNDLIEGVDVYYPDGEFIGFIPELSVNDEILDRDNLPELYSEEDYILQQERINEAVKYII